MFVFQIKLNNAFSWNHLHEFVALWSLIQDFQLYELVDDDISWKHTTSGHYSVTSAYNAQLLGLIFTFSPMEHAVWKAPPKTKLFAWLAIQDRIWTADRLAKRGWPNCGLCPLCRPE